MNRYLTFTLAILSVSLLVVLCCVPQPLELENFQWNVKVTNFKVFYDGKTSPVLSWTPPDSAFDFYRVFRTRQVDSLGKPDTTTLVADEARDSISKESTSFTDVVEPADGEYYYRMCAVKFINGKNLQGLMTPIVACTVGTGTHFSINHGDIFTVSNICTLFVKDPWSKINAVRFTPIDT